MNLLRIFYRDLSWSHLKNVIKQEVGESNWVIVDKKLNELCKSAKELVGTEESIDVIDDACIYLLRLFLDQKIVMLKHTAEMKKIFGQFSNQLVNQICAVSIYFIK